MVIPPDEPAANVRCRPSLTRRPHECIHCLALLQRRVLRGWGACWTSTRHVERHPGCASGRAAQRIGSARAGSTGETIRARRAYYVESWPAGRAAPATFSARGVSKRVFRSLRPTGWAGASHRCPVGLRGSVPGIATNRRRTTRRLPHASGAPPYKVRRPATQDWRSHLHRSGPGQTQGKGRGMRNSNGCRTSCRTRRPPRIAGTYPALRIASRTASLNSGSVEPMISNWSGST